MSRVGTAHQFFNGWSTNEWWAVPTLHLSDLNLLDEPDALATDPENGE